MNICSYISSIRINYFLLQEPTVLSRLSYEFLSSMKFSWQICKAVPSCQENTYESIYQPKMIQLLIQKKLYTPFRCDSQECLRISHSLSSMLTSIPVLDSIPYSNYPIPHSASWNHLENKLIALNFAYQCF